jgi:hypothetical protein
MTSAWRASAPSSRCSVGIFLYVYGDTPETRRWIEILRAEVVGQRLFYERHKRFVDDQRGFIEAYLQNPEDTLLWSLW